MSRTFNTRPYWIRVQDDLSLTEERHWCEEHPHRYYYWFQRVSQPVCDIDTGPKANCVRHYISNHNDTGPQYGPTRSYINDTWARGDRARSRDECREAARDFNTTGDVEVIVRTAPHRHGARWNWW